MIALGDVREDDLRRPAEQVRGRHAEHRRRHRPGRRHRLRPIGRPGEHRGPRRHAAAYATENAASPRRAHHGHRGRTRPAVLSFVVDDPPVSALDVGTQARPGRHRHAHRAPLLPAGDGSLRPARHRAPRSPCTTPRRRSTTSPPPCAGSSRRHRPARAPPRRRRWKRPTPRHGKRAHRKPPKPWPTCSNRSTIGPNAISNHRLRQEDSADAGRTEDEANYVRGCQSQVR